MKKLSISLLITALLFSGCMSMKPSSSKSAKKYFETFYVGEDGTQYFIKPLEFESEASEAELLIDMTFRYKDQIKDSARIHLTIEGPKVYKSISDLSFRRDTLVIKGESIALMFNESNKKGFKSRFSTQVALKDLNQLFQTEQWRVLLSDGQQELSFTPTKKSQKIIQALRDNVFVLM